uniref:Dehydrogenase n=1 Tax=Glossina morsitans morsitans TaxID=37546 RepID=A0A1B0FBK0_GLOMM
MERWHNKLAIVTGASAGIGAACTKALLSAGLRVIGLARREQKLEELKESLPQVQKSKFIPRKCDVSKEQDVLAAFEWSEKELGGVDVLLNNAGITRQTELVAPNNTEKIRQVIDTNVMGVLWCTREAFQRMHKRGNEGHILIINSLAGQQGLCPGAVDTNIFPDEIQFYVKNMALLEPQNIADAVLYALKLPPHVQVVSKIMIEIVFHIHHHIK